MIVQSGNDASIAIAEHVAGSEEAFASLMNQYAQRLGMTGSHFVNAHGLSDPEHYSTAHDIALLSQALIRDFPDEYAYYKLKEFTFNNIRQHNRSEEHPSELQSLMRNSYAVFCLKKKNNKQ